MEVRHGPWVFSCPVSPGVLQLCVVVVVVFMVVEFSIRKCAMDLQLFLVQFHLVCYS